MRKSQIMRLALLCASIDIASQSAVGAEYKCKDSKGNWTAEACTGKTAPPKPPAPVEPVMPQIGMTTAEAIVTAFPWGFPDKINNTRTAAGDKEQWVYKDARGFPVRYLYFTNGVLTAIQE